ncbi:hypothetical protein PPERSA_09701 [Pseudocohnilembus persalinus]|uniref:Uncharacterized protein n=1 Tax=Pseudocohnilembus persalinus TaxID=266149 RepID=A0A0V0QUP1_PSEPJ|nr:hypothetical protein PPERSA_09701 [Pseudocohnilembus persalinus]|eukprot:KRX06089.1 hypothetical protein PPERSA_09701 [Pseudocohnilembus persalinus]
MYYALVRRENQLKEKEAIQNLNEISQFSAEEQEDLIKQYTEINQQIQQKKKQKIEPSQKTDNKVQLSGWNHKNEIKKHENDKIFDNQHPINNNKVQKTSIQNSLFNSQTEKSPYKQHKKKNKEHKYITEQQLPQQNTTSNKFHEYKEKQNQNQNQNLNTSTNDSKNQFFQFLNLKNNKKLDHLKTEGSLQDIKSNYNSNSNSNLLFSERLKNPQKFTDVDISQFKTQIINKEENQLQQKYNDQYNNDNLKIQKQIDSYSNMSPSVQKHQQYTQIFQNPDYIQQKQKLRSTTMGFQIQQKPQDIFIEQFDDTNIKFTLNQQQQQNKKITLNHVNQLKQIDQNQQRNNYQLTNTQQNQKLQINPKRTKTSHNNYRNQIYIQAQNQNTQQQQNQQNSQQKQQDPKQNQNQNNQQKLSTLIFGNTTVTDQQKKNQQSINIPIQTKSLKQFQNTMHHFRQSTEQLENQQEKQIYQEDKEEENNNSESKQQQFQKQMLNFQIKTQQQFFEPNSKQKKDVLDKKYQLISKISTHYQQKQQMYQRPQTQQFSKNQNKYIQKQQQQNDEQTNDSTLYFQRYNNKKSSYIRQKEEKRLQSLNENINQSDQRQIKHLNYILNKKEVTFYDHLKNQNNVANFYKNQLQKDQQNKQIKNQQEIHNINNKEHYIQNIIQQQQKQSYNPYQQIQQQFQDNKKTQENTQSTQKAQKTQEQKNHHLEEIKKKYLYIKQLQNQSPFTQSNTSNVLNLATNDIDQILQDCYTNNLQEIPQFRAALQEQHAILNLKISTIKPLQRKYSFYLLYTGYRYQKLETYNHALRCYLVVQEFFEIINWPEILGFLYKNLALTYLTLQNEEKSFEYLKKSLQRKIFLIH